MDCGMKFVKYLLFAFNLVFFILALVMIGIGAAVEIKYRDVVMITGKAISAAPILLICVGVFILMIAFFGCCGAYKENYCMVTTFAVLLVLVFILEISAGIAAFALKNKLETWISGAVKESINKYDKKLEGVFEVVQTKFHCCGATSAKDWMESQKFQKLANETIAANNIPRAKLVVPDACCVKSQMKKYCGLTANHTIYSGPNEGCVNKIEAFLKKNAGIIGGVGIGIAFMQVVGIVFACCLMRTIKKQYEVV